MFKILVKLNIKVFFNPPVNLIWRRRRKRGFEKNASKKWKEKNFSHIFSSPLKLSTKKSFLSNSPIGLSPLKINKLKSIKKIYFKSLKKFILKYIPSKTEGINKKKKK